MDRIKSFFEKVWEHAQPILQKIWWRFRSQRGKNQLIIAVVVLVLCCCCSLMAWVIVDSSLRDAGVLPTYTPTATKTPTPVPTDTPVPTNTPIPTKSPTVAPTATPTNTDVPSPTAVPTETRTPSPPTDTPPTKPPVTAPPAAVPATAVPVPPVAAYQTSAWMSVEAPSQRSPQTVFGRLLKDGAPVSGAQMYAMVNYKSTNVRVPESGFAITDSNGEASSTFNIGGASEGYTVRVDVFFSDNGQTSSASTSFTPK